MLQNDYYAHNLRWLNVTCTVLWWLLGALGVCVLCLVAAPSHLLSAGMVVLFGLCAMTMVVIVIAHVLSSYVDLDH